MKRRLRWERAVAYQMVRDGFGRSECATCLGQGIADRLFSGVEIESEHFAGVDDQGNDTSRDQDRDEQGRDGVESCPAVPFDQ